MTYALAAGLIAALGLIATIAVWYHSANSAIADLRNRLESTQTLADQYRNERDQKVVTLATSEEALATERNLRAVAEAQRNEAMGRVRELLRKHMKGATDDEIRAATADAFTSPLSLVPKELPAARRASADDLIRPGEDV